MTAEKIAVMVARKLPEPQEPVFEVTHQEALQVLAARMGSEALFLNATEITRFRDEVQDVFSLYLAERELLDLAVENWLVSRAQ